jgi:hypothetical protein
MPLTIWCLMVVLACLAQDLGCYNINKIGRDADHRNWRYKTDSVGLGCEG